RPFSAPPSSTSISNTKSNFSTLIGLQQYQHNHSLDFSHTITIHTTTISHTNLAILHGSPLSAPILPTGTMPLMPFSDSSLITKPQPTATQQRPPHPHPLRSHRSSENVLAQQSSQPNTINDLNPFRTTINFSRTYLPRRRRSMDATSFGSRETFSSPKMAAAVLSTEERFGYASRTYEQQQRKDYPVIPTRPPLRPTVSFGSVSVATFTSHDSIWKEKNGAIPSLPKKRGCLAFLSCRRRE
ncbi:hypothetical protein HII31_04003, partial [Pseudocercospora fuligena]